MWILFLILLTPTGEVRSTTPLTGYELHKECMVEATYVQLEMEKAYPKDKGNFRFECWIQRKDVS